MQECEGPWVDNRAASCLVPNMVFNIDIWIADESCGVRYEDGVVVTKDGLEILTGFKREIVRI